MRSISNPACLSASSTTSSRSVSRGWPPGGSVRRSQRCLRHCRSRSLCGIGYGLRQIIETQAKSGASVERVVISGGAGASPLVRQILADACGKPVVAPAAEEPVLLGSAILGSVAAGAFPDVRDAMRELARSASIHTPSGERVATLHEGRYQAFLNLQDVSRALRSL